MSVPSKERCRRKTRVDKVDERGEHHPLSVAADPWTLLHGGGALLAVGSKSSGGGFLLDVLYGLGEERRQVEATRRAGALIEKPRVNALLVD